MATTTYHVLESDTPSGLQDLVNNRLARVDAKWDLVGGIAFSEVVLEQSNIALVGEIDDGGTKHQLRIKGMSTPEGGKLVNIKVFAQAMTQTTLK